MTVRAAILGFATAWLLSLSSHALADDLDAFTPPAVAAIEQFPVPAMTEPNADVAPFEYEDVGPKIPNYLANQQWGTQGDIITKMQKPLSPEESLKHYIVPKNFHLELFLDESDLRAKPISMNWDERGRLWISETVDYPNELMPPAEGRDRIRICEDTDQDGSADKFTVFAEKLSIPTGIEFCHDGIVIQAGVETLFLRDTDGDDKADQREALITGWAMNDTHGGVSNFNTDSIIAIGLCKATTTPNPNTRVANTLDSGKALGLSPLVEHRSILQLRTSNSFVLRTTTAGG